MINNLPFTDQQAKTIFTLLASNQTEQQIVKTTGMSLRLVQHIIQSRRQSMSERVAHHQARIAQSERMVDAIREMLGFDPLYEGAVDETEHTKDHHLHVKGKIERARLRQAKKIKMVVRKVEQPSVLDQLLVMSK